MLPTFVRWPRAAEKCIHTQHSVLPLLHTCVFCTPLDLHEILTFSVSVFAAKTKQVLYGTCRPNIACSETELGSDKSRLDFSCKFKFSKRAV